MHEVHLAKLIYFSGNYDHADGAASTATAEVYADSDSEWTTPGNEQPSSTTAYNQHAATTG